MAYLRLVFLLFLLVGWIWGPDVPTAATLSEISPPSGRVSTVPAQSAVGQGEDPQPHSGYRLDLHPDGVLYVGDSISIEVIAPPDEEVDEKQVEIQIDSPTGITLGPVNFAPFGIGGRQQATFWWAWDTRSLSPGEHTLTIRILPAGPSWTEVVQLEPIRERVNSPLAAEWRVVDTDCCTVHYISGTAVERDLALLLDIAEQKTLATSRRLGVDVAEPIPLVLIPRLLGHGGFVSDKIYISYLDRNYAGSHPEMVLHHEIIHLLDGRLGGRVRPSLLVEGLAVYLSGGHYKDEPLLARAAVLEDMGRYLPLAALLDSFYLSQHEVGYLEAGALVEFMVNTWGYEQFMAFYRDIRPHPSGGQAQAMDQSLQEHFGLTLDQLERQFLTTLRRYPLIPDLYADVVLTVQFYDTLRRYQKLLDPSAYFLSAWIPSVDQMQERELVADYARTPSEPINLALEALLVTAEEHLWLGQFQQTERILGVVNAVLDAYEGRDQRPMEVHAHASATMAIVNSLMDDGSTVQKLNVHDDQALVWVVDIRGDRQVIRMVKREGVWQRQ